LIYFRTPQVTLYQGHCLEVLRSLSPKSVNCVVGSPPYKGQRSYGTDPQVWGGNPRCSHEWASTPYYQEGGASVRASEAFTAPGAGNATRIKKTRWKNEVRCAHCGAWQGELGQEQTVVEFVAHLAEICAEVYRVLADDGVCWINLGDTKSSGKTYISATQKLAEKNLCLIPQRLAIALQDFGWVVRSEVIWHKAAAKPESVTDRPTYAHEQIWMLTKGSKYWYDQDAVRQPLKTVSNIRNKAKEAWTKGAIGSCGEGEREWNNPNGANLRDVWELGPDNYKAPAFLGVDHFATFPREIPRRCIAASCPSGGVVLDPFAGSGTALVVAQEMGRQAIGIELNPDSCRIIEHRCRQLTIPGLELQPSRPSASPEPPSQPERKQLSLLEAV
jgi:DNA modification methylase